MLLLLNVAASTSVDDVFFESERGPYFVQEMGNTDPTAVTIWRNLFGSHRRQRKLHKFLTALFLRRNNQSLSTRFL